jgi:parallel beta-helix repeat protein
MDKQCAFSEDDLLRSMDKTIVVRASVGVSYNLVKRQTRQGRYWVSPIKESPGHDHIPSSLGQNIGVFMQTFVFALLVCASCLAHAATGYSVSDAFILDTAEPLINITNPSSGSMFALGQPLPIQWDMVESNVPPNSVSIHWRGDPGSEWTLIASGETPDGAYEWTAPVNSYPTAQLRVAMTDAFGNVGEEESGSFAVSEPYINFSANVNTGYVPLVVQFADESIGIVSSWEWDLNGDGVTDSREQNPTWTYDLPGQYDVTLSIDLESYIRPGHQREAASLALDNYISASLNPALTKSVPAQYTTIQAAIDASSDGDYILVADGIYYENLQIVGKQVTLASHYFLDGDTLHIDNTVIDGSMRRDRDEGSVIAIRPGANPNLSSHIVGFTVTHGRGRSITETQGGVTVTKNVGGGFYVESNSPILTMNKVIENDAEDEGGGSFAFQGLPNLGGMVTEGRVNYGGNLFRDNQANVGKDIYVSGTGARDVISAENCGFTVFCAQDTTVSGYWATSQANIDYSGSHGQREAVTSDVWVATDGNNANDGLSPTSPFLTIDHALSLVYGSQANPLTIHLEPGVYSSSQTGERYPLQMVSWVTLAGAGRDETILDAEATADAPCRVVIMDKAEGCQIRDLTVTGGVVSSDRGSHGAGIFLLDSDAVCDSLSLFFNTAASNGGGIYAEAGELSLRNSNVSQNGAHYGAGIYANACSVTVSGCEVASNQTTGSLRRGGGIYLDTCDQARLESNIIKANTADTGAGVYLQNATNVRLLGNRIVNNTQSVSSFSNGGGGLYWNNACSGIVANNLIANNTAYQGGAGFGLSALDFRNNTIANNRANYRGGAFYLNACSPDYLNTILWGNTAASGGNQLWLQTNSSDPNLRYCDVQGGSAAFGLSTGSYTGTYQNNLSLIPQFLAPTSGVGSNYDALLADWSIPEASPCVNTGDPATDVSLYPLDLAGNPRVDGASIDIGAYEYQFTAAPGIPGDVSIEVADGQILLQWDAVPNAQSYRVLASENATGPFELDITAQGTLSLDTGRYTWSMPLNTELRRFYVVKSSTSRESYRHW